MNPGGPGGSGVAFALGAGPALQNIINGSRVHDIISFDPRGVGFTEPAVSCSGSRATSTAWRIRVMEEGTLNSSNAALGRLWSMSHALGHTCASVGDESIHRYLTTASVARDMLEIVEAHGRWRERQVAMLREQADPKEQHSALYQYKSGGEKMQYWGFSYGTYLGSTFASMFPDRIHRLILDGVVDAEDYTAGLWYDNLIDSEKTLHSFYYHCARVGYPKCPLAGPKYTATDVEKRVQDVVANLHFNPLTYSTSTMSEIITYSDVRSLIFTSLYSPLTTFANLAKLLADVEKGDGRELSKLVELFYSFSCADNDESRDPKL